MPSLPASAAPLAAVAPARSRSPALPASLPTVLAVVLAVGAWAAWTWLAVARYAGYQAYLRDFAIYLNVLWNTGHDVPFRTTLLVKNVSHLAEHVAPALLPVALLFRLVPEPRLLIALQQAALALSGLPVFLLARRRLGPWPAVAVLAGYYLAPNLADVIALSGFYPVALATLPIACGAYFMLSGRPGLGALVAVPTILVEETSVLALLGLGLLLLARRRWRSGLAVTAVAVVWLVLVTQVVEPAFSLEEALPGGENRALHKFGDVLDAPVTVVTYLAERGPQAVAWLLLPAAGLPLLAPQVLLAGLPTALVLLLQNDETFHSHRVAPLIPLVWLGTVEGLALLRGGWRLRLGLALLVAAALVSYVRDSPLPGGGRYSAGQASWGSVSEAFRPAVESVPPDASVVASGNALAALSARREIYTLHGQYAKGLFRNRRYTWYVIDVGQDWFREPELANAQNPLRVSNPPLDIWLADGTLLAATTHLPVPARSVDAAFGDVLRLEGYDVQPAGGGLRVELGWRVQQKPKQDLRRHLELLAADGTLLAAQDGPAHPEVLGTRQWQRGQLVVEDVHVPLDLSAAAAARRLRVSWSDAGGPLSLADGSAALELSLP